MNADTDPHPSAEELAAFDAGCLPAPQAAAVETHVAACQSCCRRLEEMPEDAFAALVRAYAGKADGGRTRPLARGDGAATEVPEALVGHPRYRVLGLLGQGGMGVVYKAVQQHMDRVVALKVIHRPLLACPDFVERFRREVKAVARLRHANIVLAYDADQAGDLHFLVMEHVEGTSLDRVVSRRGPLPVAEACEYVRQAALGLQHAHEQGLVHRDVKPHNLLLTPQGQIKVVDFGLAHLARAGTAATPVTSAPLLGTPDYTAPEQARDPSGVDVRADVYSLGCTLYFLLTGQVPFPGGTPLQKLLSHQERPPRPVTELRPEVPPALAAALGRMLAKDRARRPATPGEVASELAPFAAAAPQETVPLPPPRRGASRRWTLLLGAGMGALLAVGVAAGLAAWWHGRAKDEAKAETKAGPPGPAEPQPPAEAPADLLSPDQLARLKRQAGDRAAAWVREHSSKGPTSGFAVGTQEQIDKELSKGDGFQFLLGSALLKSGKPTVLAGRFGDFFFFELPPEEEKRVGGAPRHVWSIPIYHGPTRRRARPRARISHLHIDLADRLPRDQRVTGSVAYEIFEPLDGEPLVRLTYYPSAVQRSCAGMYYPPGGLASDRGEISFDMPEFKARYAPHDRFLVVFVELGTLKDGRETIESNTLATLVRPLPPPPAPQQGK
jgi:hypothetical protein